MAIWSDEQPGTERERAFRRLRKAHRFVAVCGTFVFPGIGHLLVGARLRGALWLIVVLGVLGIQIGMLFSAVLFKFLPPIQIVIFIIIVAVVIDAWRVGGRMQCQWPKTTERAYSVGFVLLITSIGITYPAAANIKRHFVRCFIMYGDSMLPTLHDGDGLVVRPGKLPRRWELLVYKWPTSNEPTVGRAVGLPGDLLALRPDGIWINGKLEAPPGSIKGVVDTVARASSQTSMNGGDNPIRLQSDEYFILGDNARSRDSRSWSTPFGAHQKGALPTDLIIGVIIGIDDKQGNAYFVHGDQRSAD
jgi:signal peptidase I